jgi:hypothetical protein
MQFRTLTLSRRRTEAFSDAEFATKIDAAAVRARSLYLAGFIRQI